MTVIDAVAEPRMQRIHEALADVMADVRSLAKDERNATQNFNFRGIDATLNAIGPALRDHAIVVLPEIKEHASETVEVGRNKTPMKSVLVVVRYRFVGPAGDYLDVTVPGEAMDAGDKAFSKAMSVAFRTALLQTFALPTQEKDPDHDTYERAPSMDIVDMPPNQLDVLKSQLLAKVRQLGKNPGDVAQLYLADNRVSIQNETNADRLRSFIERLEPR